MLRLELALLWRERLARAALVLLVVLASVALWNGHVEDRALRLQVDRLQAQQATASDETLDPLVDPVDAGALGYAMVHLVPQSPPPLAWLHLGDALSEPVALRIRLLGLEGQRHAGGNAAPERAAAGSLDFAFVVVVLMPLVALVLVAPLASAEREAGRDALLASLAVQPRVPWSRRVALRWAALGAAVLVPLAVAAITTGRLDSGLFGIAAATLLYAAIWCTAGAALALRWRQHATDTVATRLLGGWLVLVVALPALAGMVLDRTLPEVPGSRIALEHRLVLNDAWDRPKEDTLAAFVRYHPEWRGTAPIPPTQRFHWKWYYAFHHLADRHVDPWLSEREHARQARVDAKRVLGLVMPTVAMLDLLDGLADQGLERAQARESEVRDFHDRLRAFFYPALFADRPMTRADLASLPVPEPAAPAVRRRDVAILSLGIALLLGIVALRREASRAG